MYITNLLGTLEEKDPKNTALFKMRMEKFHPRLVLNMVDDPKDADRAIKIRRSCQQYLGIDIEHLGILFRDTMQDRALTSRLPVVVYKPQSILAQAIYRVAEKIIQSETISFDDDYDITQNADASFENAAEEAAADFHTRMSYVEELAGTGALSVGELSELIAQQQFELTRLKNENNLLKRKLVKAVQQGFKV